MPEAPIVSSETTEAMWLLDEFLGRVSAHACTPHQQESDKYVLAPTPDITSMNMAAREGKETFVNGEYVVNVKEYRQLSACMAVLFDLGSNPAAYNR